MLHAIIPQPCDLRFTGGVCPVQRPQIFFDAAVAPEGYVLTVSKEGVRIRCSTDKGSFYAAQTLRQLQKRPVQTVPQILRRQQMAGTQKNRI